jgi:hypothetical protein
MQLFASSDWVRKSTAMPEFGDTVDEPLESVDCQCIFGWMGGFDLDHGMRSGHTGEHGQSSLSLGEVGL